MPDDLKKFVAVFAEWEGLECRIVTIEFRIGSPVNDLFLATDLESPCASSPASGNARRAELEDASSFLRLARPNRSEGWAKCDQLGQLLRCGITNQAMVAHFHNRDGSDPFRQQHLWLESYVKCFQGKAHLLLQGLQPGENDGTERTAEEAVKIHGNGRGGRIGMRRRNGSELIHDPPIAEKARDVGEEIKERPAQARHARHPQQNDNPLALITEIRQANGVAYPGKRKTGNIALLFLELRVHRYLHTETTATDVRSNTRKVTKEFRAPHPTAGRSG